MRMMKITSTCVAQGFDEPAGLEQRLIRLQHHQHDVKCQKVEGRADRPDHQHEVANEIHIQNLRTAHIFAVDRVERDRDLRHVVENVVEENLCRHHRQKRQEQGRAGHAEHVAEIRARPHHDVFHDVRECATSLHHAVVQDGQILIEQIMSAASRATSTARFDRQPDIGGMQDGAIIDAVAQIAHHMAPGLDARE